MKKEYTYKFRLFPTEKQKVLLNKHFGSIRFVYNYFLDRRNKFYLNAKEKQLAKKSLNYLDDAKALTELKKQDDKDWLYECNAQSLQHSLKHLDGAFNRFYKKLGGFPRFKNKRSKQIFRVPQTVEIRSGKVCFTKFIEGIAYDKHREIEGEIQNATNAGDRATSSTLWNTFQQAVWDCGKSGCASANGTLKFRDYDNAPDGAEWTNQKIADTTFKHTIIVS